MSDHTLLNLLQVEDSAASHGMGDTMEARFPGAAIGLSAAGMSLQTVKAGRRQPFAHRHATQEELYVVVAGSGRVKLADEVVALTTWDALRVAPGVVRCFEGGPEGLTYLAFGAPKTEGQDGEMLPVDWD